ncbi:cation:proton antiporter [Mycobacterium intracellulare]|uniref:cation:proton antiporter n=1 Tax=Mycobacterium intracellulare TaxID=1767 RepID=UPI001EEDEB48|nr:cation:proton antiporter [Mycobacterium intracellulare]MEE3755352.1 cation:proton antiporter [Mycobacterium intracellulare]
MPLGDVLQGLVTLTLVVICAALAKELCRRCNQPTVLGPIVFGLVVGTAVAAGWHPAQLALSGASKFLVDAAGTGGLLLLMFSVGLELRSHRAPGQRSTGRQLISAVAFPIVVCAAAACPFAHQLTGSKGNPLSAWIFVGVALGVTAVPVLVLVIADLGISSSPVAQTAMRISVLTDGFAWAMMTLLLIVSTNIGAASLGELGVGAVLMAVVVAVLPRMFHRISIFQQNTARAITMFAYALTGAAGTQLLGLHPALGAVIAGYFFPAALTSPDAKRVLAMVIDMLIPAFFVVTALSIPLQTLRGQFGWRGVLCLLTLTVAAFASKILAGYACGRMAGYSSAASGQLGVLLNCRGVTEIAIASVGYQAHLVDAYAFALLCALAILTTAVTAPLFRAVNRVGRVRDRTRGRTP